MEFWVQVHNLPLDRMNVENSTKIREHLGQFVRADLRRLDTAKVNKFMRIRLSVDIKSL